MSQSNNYKSFLELLAEEIARLEEELNSASNALVALSEENVGLKNDSDNKIFLLQEEIRTTRRIYRILRIISVLNKNTNYFND